MHTYRNIKMGETIQQNNNISERILENESNYFEKTKYSCQDILGRKTL